MWAKIQAREIIGSCCLTHGVGDLCGQSTGRSDQDEIRGCCCLVPFFLLS